MKVYTIEEIENIKKNDIPKYIQLLINTLCFCDPRENYGFGMECQFCNATSHEYHKPNCIYRQLTNN